MTSVLTPSEFTPFSLAEIVPVNHNTKIYRFKLPDQVSLGLPVASCVLVRGKIGDELVTRPYTPITSNRVKGHFDLMIKSYPAGKLSAHFATLKPGQTLEFQGPFKKVEYVPKKKKCIAMIAGGTGITPMLQVIEESLNHPNDTTKFLLIFANVTEGDILLRERLEGFARSAPGRLEIRYVLEKTEGLSKVKASKGYVTADLLKSLLPAPAPDMSIFVCGPPPMMKAISGDKNPDKSQGPLTGILAQLGYTSDHVFKF
ncbi:NADH-cytochrome b5 reductase [Plasmodiophora brassicae]|nr:hypothetical protein PBRA_008117 [Plasmodiophora brassicae]